jgi:hypothetical protein
MMARAHAIMDNSKNGGGGGGDDDDDDGGGGGRTDGHLAAPTFLPDISPFKYQDQNGRLALPSS